MGSITGVVRDAQGKALSGVSIRIYNDYDYHPAPFRTDAQGKYSIVLGVDGGMFHLVVVGSGNIPASNVLDLNYQGGLSNACRWTVDWTRTE
jgi:hypothetical protein